MEKELKLYLIMLGCTTEGRFTEQHDIFFGIGNSLKELIPNMKDFWSEAKGRIRIDFWREAFVMKSFSILFGFSNSRFKTSHFKPKKLEVTIRTNDYKTYNHFRHFE